MAILQIGGKCHIGREAAVQSLQAVLDAVPQKPHSIDSDNFGGFIIEWRVDGSELIIGVNCDGQWGSIIRTNIDSMNADRTDELSIIQQTVVRTVPAKLAPKMYKGNELL